MQTHGWEMCCPGGRSRALVTALVLVACNRDPRAEAKPREQAAMPSEQSDVHPGQLPGHASTRLELSCRAERAAGQITITYVAANRGDDDAYILDLTATPHADHRTFDVDVKPIYLAWLGGRKAHLGQGIAPLPPDRDVYARVIPFASRLAPGASLTRTIQLPVPLAEQGPYDPPAQGPAVSIDQLVLSLSAMRPAAPGFRREEVADHPGVFRVASKYTVGDVERARCAIDLPATELHTFELRAGQIATFLRAE